MMLRFRAFAACITLLSTLTAISAPENTYATEKPSQCSIKSGKLHVAPADGVRYTVAELRDSSGHSIVQAIVPASERESSLLPVGVIFGSVVSSVTCSAATSDQISDETTNSKCIGANAHADEGYDPTLVSISRTGSILFVAGRIERVDFARDRVPAAGILAVVLDGQHRGSMITNDDGSASTLVIEGVASGSHTLVLQTIDFSSGRMVENAHAFCFLTAPSVTPNS